MDTDRVLILQEVDLHPNSKLVTIEGAFERPSILHVVSRDGLRGITKPPAYDAKYLALFESIKVFSSNLAYLRLDAVFPVVTCRNKSMAEDAIGICRDKDVSYSYYYNPFKKEDAYDLIRQLSSVQVSESFCKSLVSRVGVNPRRIVSSITVFEQIGYKEDFIARYIDKYIYIDIFDVIESLLGICKSKAQKKRAALYIHMNRLWYNKFTRDRLVKEVSSLMEIYKDFLNGDVTTFTLQEYLDTHKVSRYRVMYTRELLGQISLTRLIALQNFLQQASILEVAMNLS